MTLHSGRRLPIGHQRPAAALGGGPLDEVLCLIDLSCQRDHNQSASSW